MFARLFSLPWQQQVKVIGAEELARHNKAGDAWVAIDGIVYDVSTYEKRHPGGKILVNNSGNDLSEEFHSLHRRGTEKVLAKLPKIGKLLPPEPDPDI